MKKLPADAALLTSKLCSAPIKDRGKLVQTRSGCENLLGPGSKLEPFSHIYTFFLNVSISSGSNGVFTNLRKSVLNKLGFFATDVIHGCVSAYASVQVCVSVCACKCVCACVAVNGYECVYRCVCECVCMCARVCARECVCMCVIISLLLHCFPLCFIPSIRPLQTFISIFCLLELVPLRPSVSPVSLCVPLCPSVSPSVPLCPPVSPCFPAKQM